MADAIVRARHPPRRHPPRPPRVDDGRPGQGQRRPAGRGLLPPDGRRRRPRDRARPRRARRPARVWPGWRRRSSRCGWPRPPLAGIVSRPPVGSGGTALAAADAQALRLIARRTWRFFEAFVGPEDHALPPDNFQEDPQPVVAHRTSPTNIGLYLLSTVTAQDLGWIGTADMVERLEATLATIDQLERFRGHLYNWYDTRTLEPLGRALRLHGRQRQPGRSSPRGLERLPRDPRPPAAVRAGLQRDRRRADPGRRGGAGRRRRGTVPDADAPQPATRRCARPGACCTTVEASPATLGRPARRRRRHAPGRSPTSPPS